MKSENTWIGVAVATVLTAAGALWWKLTRKEDSCRPPCCDACKTGGTCDGDRACCLECHFLFEERVSKGRLPPALYNQLRAAHARLFALGFPPEEIAAHAKWEMEIFRKYLPDRFVAQIILDHGYYELGELRTRDSVAETEGG